MRRFWSNEQGSMITMFTISIVPVLALMGAAVDYSRASLVRTQMQSALDATAGFLSRLPVGTSVELLDLEAKTFFYANYAESDVPDIQIKIEPGGQPGDLKLGAVGIFNSVMVNFFGIANFPIHVETEVKRHVDIDKVALEFSRRSCRSSKIGLTCGPKSTR